MDTERNFPALGIQPAAHGRSRNCLPAQSLFTCYWASCFGSVCVSFSLSYLASLHPASGTNRVLLQWGQGWYSRIVFSCSYNHQNSFDGTNFVSDPEIEFPMSWGTAHIWELPLSSPCTSLCSSFVCLSQFACCLEQTLAFGNCMSVLHTGLKDGLGIF